MLLVFLLCGCWLLPFVVLLFCVVMLCAAKECGLHSGNIKQADGTTQERKAERDLWIDGSAVETLDKAAAEKLAAGDRDQDTLLVLYAPWCPFCQVRG